MLIAFMVACFLLFMSIEQLFDQFSNKWHAVLWILLALAMMTFSGWLIYLTAS